MPILLTINISDPSSALASGYDQIKVYRSAYEDGGFNEISTVATRPAIVSNVYYYDFDDSTGTASSWYKTSYYSSSSGDESSLSVASHGVDVVHSYINITYPSEIELSPSDYFHVDRIRFYIGDSKKVVHDYVSPTCTVGYQNISDDGYSYKLPNRGWPLYVAKDGVEYTSSTNPYVTDYTYLTFSGTQISTASGVLDLWYETFRHSDRSLLDTFISMRDPPNVDASSVTNEMRSLGAAINILRAEVTQLMGETSGSFTLVDELSYNPEPLLRQKRALIEELKGKLKTLIDEAVGSSIVGVRID